MSWRSEAVTKLTRRVSFEVALFPSDKYVKNRVFLSFQYPRQQKFVQAISEKLRFMAEKRQINSATSKRVSEGECSRTLRRECCRLSDRPRSRVGLVR